MRTMYMLTTDDRPTSHFGKIRTAISWQRVIRSTSCLVLVSGFRGRRIEWTYFRLDQIQDGGWKISNNHISGMSYPIHFHELQSSLGGIQEKIMREE